MEKVQKGEVQIERVPYTEEEKKELERLKEEAQNKSE